MRGVAAPWCQTCRSLDGALVSTWTSPVSALRLLAHLGPAPSRSSRPCASSLISAMSLLAHLGPVPPRSSRPCASSLISALRLSSILQLIAEKTLRRISHALPAAPHPSRIPRMKLRTSCMRVFSSCPCPPHSHPRLLWCDLIIEKTIPNHFSGQAHALTAAWREQNDFLYLLRTAPITCRSHQFLLSPRRCATRAARPSMRMATKRITSNC